ncbi:MAG: ATPase AAA [marine bacterium B5-7]|nr:MAG: ATPase AAA [marine bacterium B5-7]
MDIGQLCTLGESKTLEYKRNTDSLVSILKSIIAFANTAGGTVLIGIDDDGSVVGVDEPGKIQEQLANSIANRIKPQLVPDMHAFFHEEKTVIAIQVETLHGAYYLGDRGEEKGVYVRIGNSNHLAGIEMIRELHRSVEIDSFDRQCCFNSTEQDLDKIRISEVFSSHTESIEKEKLYNLGIIIKSKKQWVATNGGIILFGFPEVRQRQFPYAEVRCARFSGKTRAEFLDRLSLTGGILSAVDEVPNFIRRNTKMAGKFGSMVRKDIAEYPTEGIREALVNALVHANYEISGSRVFIGIYDDRLEIQNPGVMLPGMSIEQFKEGVSRIRNPVIARVFSALGLVEEWGSGYKRIVASCQKGGYPLPKWEEFGTALRVTFYPHPDTVQLSHKSGTQLAPSPASGCGEFKVDAEARRILRFCRHPKAFHLIKAHMGWHDRTKFRRRFIRPLLDLNLIRETIPCKPTSSKQQYIITDKGRAVLRVPYHDN